MMKLAPDRLLRARKDDVEASSDVVRMVPDFDADADENTLQSALLLVDAAVLLLKELLEEKKLTCEQAFMRSKHG